MGVWKGVAACFVAAACAACSGGGTSADPSAPLTKPEAAPQVQSIIQNMRERDRSARTYSDEGTYRSVSRGPKGDVVGTFTARFRTRWRAPDRLGFEFHEDPSDFNSGGLIAVWTPRTGVTKSWFSTKSARTRHSTMLLERSKAILIERPRNVTPPHMSS